jgi:hypothetical protein
MKYILFILAVLVVCGTNGLNSVQAQERRPGGPEGAMMRMSNPLVTALDTNKDGVIDEKEIANAAVALKKLDKNGDGKLTEDELRPALTRPAVAGGGGAEQMVRRLMEFDKNGDGKLSKDELPERMQSLMQRADTDKDGFLTKDEIRKVAESPQTFQPAAREGREGGDRPPERPAPAR